MITTFIDLFTMVAGGTNGLDASTGTRVVELIVVSYVILMRSLIVLFMGWRTVLWGWNILGASPPVILCRWYLPCAVHTPPRCAHICARRSTPSLPAAADVPTCRVDVLFVPLRLVELVTVMLAQLVPYLRVLDILRSLRLMRHFRSVQIVQASVRRAVRLLVTIIGLVFFFFFLFAIVGVQAFAGVLRRVCVAPNAPNVSWAAAYAGIH